MCKQKKLDLKQAKEHILKGEVIIAPTEGVWGLIANPFEYKVVKKLDNLKNRFKNKSYLLVIGDWKQIDYLIKTLPYDLKNKLLNNRKFITWVIEDKLNFFPDWIKLKSKVAIRLCKHKLLSKLSIMCDIPLIATSANLSNEESVTNLEKILENFPNLSYLSGNLLTKDGNPSSIYDLKTDKCYR